MDNTELEQQVRSELKKQRISYLQGQIGTQYNKKNLNQESVFRVNRFAFADVLEPMHLTQIEYLSVPEFASAIGPLQRKTKWNDEERPVNLFEDTVKYLQLQRDAIILPLVNIAETDFRRLRNQAYRFGAIRKQFGNRLDYIQHLRTGFRLFSALDDFITMSVLEDVEETVVATMLRNTLQRKQEHALGPENEWIRLLNPELNAIFPDYKH